MSYHRSRARVEFESQLSATTNNLAALHRLAKIQGNGPKLLGAFYVLAYSHLELYVKAIVEDSLDVLKSENPPIEKLPDLMLGYMVHKGGNLGACYRRFNLDEDEGNLLDGVSKAVRDIEAWAGGNFTIRNTSAADFLERRKYPSPRNFPPLFRRIGIRQIWAVIGRAGGINGELVLTSLNDLRTGVAHEGIVPPGFGIRDFRDRIKQMRNFVAALDRGVSAHFCSLSINRSKWNSLIT